METDNGGGEVKVCPWLPLLNCDCLVEADM